MDIEAIVKKYERLIPAGAYTLGEGIRAALTELSETHAIELRAYEATVANQAERIRQLEAERVPDAIVVSSEWLRRIHRDLDACQKVIWLGMRDADPSYCADAKARLKEIDAMLAAAPQQKKEGEDREDA